MFAARGASSRFIAIDLSNDHFTAVQLSASHSGVKVGARLSLDIPPDIEPSDDEWLGKWMARSLEEHRFGRAPVAFVVPRQSVGLKHLVLPSTRIDELPGMVAIKLAGQLPFPADGSITDYAVLRQSEGQSEVVAAAARHELIDRYRSLAQAGGLKIDRIALRPLATAALAAEISRTRSGSLLAIDLRRYGEVELVVVSDGKLRFARAAEVFSSTEKVDRHEEARRLATEAKRSWMSFRATEDSPDVEHVLIIGTDGLAGGVATEVRSALDRPTEVLLSHPKVSGDTSTLGSIWPLVGVGLEAAEDLDGINFGGPKEAPDLAARQRQRILAGIAAGVVVFGGLWTAGNVHLRRLEEQRDNLADAADELLPDYYQVERTRLRLEHLQRWEAAQFEWLDHLAFVSDHLPPTDQAILGSFGASSTEPSLRWKDQKWSVAAPIASLQFSGAAISRPIADAIRFSFVNEPVYQTSPVGTDTSSNDKTYTEAFGLRLRSLRLSPYPDGEERRAAVEPATTADNAPEVGSMSSSEPGAAEPASADAITPIPAGGAVESPETVEAPLPSGGRGRRRTRGGEGG